MNVTISVPAEFHAFRLAEQLHQRDSLHRIYTTYPTYKLDTDLSRRRVRSVRHAELVRQLGRVPLVRDALPTAAWARQLFDTAVARNLEPLEFGVFVGYSGSALDSLRRANELGLVTVVERCSSHIRTQARILDEEYRRHGHDGGPIDDTYIAREEAEYAEADYVITPSEFVYRSFLEHGVSAGKVICEPFGVDVSRFSPRESNQPETTTFLFAGRVGLRKGVQYLLEAWEEADLEDAELLIAGRVEDEMRSIVERYRDNGQVVFLGWVNDLADLYHRASVFVLPTLEEGSAYVTYEAMASGLPVITTARSGWVGEDGEHGIEVPVRDSERLADAMAQLHANPKERTRLGKNCRELIEAEYTWEHYGERVHHRYRQMALGSSSG